MSDSDLTPDLGGGDVAPDTAPAPDNAPAPDAAPDVDPFDSGADHFDRPYVERLRREAAEHRTSAKQFKEAFDGYHPDEVNTLLGLVRTLASDPKTAAADLEQIVQNIREAFPDENLEEFSEEAAPAGLTKDDLEKYLSEREEAKATEQREREAVEAVDRTAKELGYEPGTHQYIALLYTAQHKTNFDLAKAHEVLEADRQKVIDDYLSKKERDADGVTPGVRGGGPSQAKTPKTWEEADAAAAARMRGTPGE